nr:hypothetical protein [uncultured Flavobacterium sp.]
MKLSFWNWVHLLSPYVLATILRIEITSEGNFIGWLAVSYFAVFAFTMLPHVDREVKTGRSFKTNSGKFDEYKTIQSNIPQGQIKTYINLSHFVGFFLIIIYAIYCLFSIANK